VTLAPRRPPRLAIGNGVIAATSTCRPTEVGERSARSSVYAPGLTRGVRLPELEAARYPRSCRPGPPGPVSGKLARVARPHRVVVRDPLDVAGASRSTRRVVIVVDAGTLASTPLLSRKADCRHGQYRTRGSGRCATNFLRTQLRSVALARPVWLGSRRITCPRSA
jgi:hypothetical protein